jgi:hypothetical protein
MGMLGSCPHPHDQAFCWKYQYNKYMFNVIDIYIFIPVCGCVGRGPRALLCLGDYNAVKTALHGVWSYLFIIWVLLIPEQWCGKTIWQDVYLEILPTNISHVCEILSLLPLFCTTSIQTIQNFPHWWKTFLYLL